MLSILKKAALLPVLILTLFIFGCEEGVPAEPPESITTPPEELTATDIAANTIYASSTIDTSWFEVATEFTVDIIGGEHASSVAMQQNTIGYLNNIEREMMFSMDILSEMPDSAPQDSSLKTYFVDDWAYMQMNMPVIGEQWLKMQLTEDMWNQQSHLGQQVEFLKTAAEINITGNETVGNTDCYVLEIIPDMAVLAQWIATQSNLEENGIQVAEQDFISRITSVSMEEWIAAGSFLPLREDFAIHIELLPGDFTNPVTGLEKAVLDIGTEIIYYDFGDIVPIELPPEAENAIEVPSE